MKEIESYRSINDHPDRIVRIRYYVWLTFRRAFATLTLSCMAMSMVAAMINYDPRKSVFFGAVIVTAFVLGSVSGLLWWVVSPGLGVGWSIGHDPGDGFHDYGNLNKFGSSVAKLAIAVSFTGWFVWKLMERGWYG